MQGFPASFTGVKKSGVAFPSVGSHTTEPCSVIISPRSGSASATFSPSAPSPSEYGRAENGIARMSLSVRRACSILSRSPVTRSDELRVEAGSTV
ncbi:MAG: hypothetical protein BWX50_00878 [Euryarchaeota archaeon ADurb.Bin009]|nr:MAG: hypothetical protein BWX50_00878 [Euryarchaeota archaeon ADurb.Bin009]